ncbi:MAG: glycosyltransferase [Lachnospiraceae bacterium]|nr:glycosyltransferase [Lachnospiraceae bacterium]
MKHTSLTISNLKKTYHYLKKNGLAETFVSAFERITEKNNAYTYTPPSEEELQRQRLNQNISRIFFSILVPVYQTPENYFREMISSVRAQTYRNWELILADASPSDRLKGVAESFHDPRIRYRKLAENRGISANTNEALSRAAGSYIGLLDHDDVLTPDALYEMAQTIEESRNSGALARVLYSDEDKWDGEEAFYDANLKPSFDQDLLWSNNYICHFLVMESTLMKKLSFRPAYDGAQDYDLTLRALRCLDQETAGGRKSLQVLNISRVLYHWRCHRESTADNPQSKRYAYEAGLAAVREDLRERGIEATVSHSKHLGFYRVDYKDIFRDRPEVAMVTGPVYHRSRIAGGALDAEGRPVYQGLLRGFDGGHLHRAGLWQSCAMGDFENSLVRTELYEAFLKEYPEFASDETAAGNSPKSVETASRSQTDKRKAWADFVHCHGCLILYDPERQ